MAPEGAHQFDPDTFRQLKARVVELADTADSKSVAVEACRFKPGLGYQISRIATPFGHGVACTGRPGPVDHKARNYAVQQLRSPLIGGVDAEHMAIDAAPRTR